MNFDIFRVDWILVDSIIIIILIVVLFSVKIYKIKHRWRNYITNNSITELALDPCFLQFEDKKIYVKKWNLLFNPLMIKIKPNLPFLFISNSHSLHYLPHALVEGLCTHGFNIIYLDIRRKWWSLKKTNSLINQESQNIIKKALEYLKSNEYELNSQYWVIDFNSYLSFEELHNNSFKQIGLILINPSLNQYHSKMVLNLVPSDKKARLNVIFSKNSYLWFRNRKIEKFMKIFSQTTTININLEVLEKANIFFKNNETILLAKIMTSIQDNN